MNKTAAAVAVVAGLIITYLWLGNPLVLLFLIIGTVALIAVSDLYRGFIILLVATQFNGYRFNVGAYTIRIEHLVLLLLIIVWTANFLQGRVRWHKTMLNKPILALIITGFVSSYLFSPDVVKSYQGVMLQMLYISMYFMAVNVLLEYPDKVKQVIKIFLVIGVAHAVWALVALVLYQAGVFVGGISPGNFGTLGLPATRGFLQESDLMGAYGGVILLLLLAHFISYRPTYLARRWVLLAAMIPPFIVIITAMARAAWLGISFCLVLMIFMLRPRFNVINPKTLGVLITSLVLFVALVFPTVNYVMSTVSGTENALVKRIQAILDFESGSGAGRVRVQKLAIEEWKESPWLGSGLFSIQGEDLPSGHWLYSTLIQALHDTGLVGFLLTLWIHLGVIVSSFAAMMKTRDPFMKATLVGFGMGAITIAVSSQASSFFWLGFPWLFMGIVMAVSIMAKGGVTVATRTGGAT